MWLLSDNNKINNNNKVVAVTRGIQYTKHLFRKTRKQSTIQDISFAEAQKKSTIKSISFAKRQQNQLSQTSVLNPVTVALSTGTTVLSCRWPESGTRPELGTRPVCQVEADFSFNHNVTDRLTLEIPVAMEQTTGLCACSVVSNSDGRPVQACNLTFKSKILFSSLSSLSVCLSVCRCLSVSVSVYPSLSVL